MRLLFLLLLLVGGFGAYAQENNDKLYLANETLDVSVEEVGMNTITYRYPGENASYVISKNRVDKIIFGSGREEVFKSNFHDVLTIDDYEKVYITYVPEDIKGLASRGEVFAKATGVTALSSINNVKNRAVKKAKIEATMLGANVIYVGNMFQRGNQYGSEETPANSTMTSISGTAYSSEPLDVKAAREYIQNHEFVYSHNYKLNRNAWDADIEPKPITNTKGEINFVQFMDIYEHDGKLMVKVDIGDNRKNELEVIKAEQDKLILMERNGKKIYNYLLITKEDPRVSNALKAQRHSTLP
ncbi:hypothetical protein [Echinicola rosea]|uniref:Uncharacterized protein n=1 Tax=Echinicola rosea TaxID=1807691 RepID=A0ABQ1V1M0_9BACT|nr:hypothetical protein [Echinicola rosea]GGF34706.1 hypothetical protein GCM10011339_23710 [Echinicola rosea]